MREEKKEYVQTETWMRTRKFQDKKKRKNGKNRSRDVIEK
jgi:hypothetical protein